MVDQDPEAPSVKEAFRGYRGQKVTRGPRENRETGAWVFLVKTANRASEGFLEIKVKRVMKVL